MDRIDQPVRLGMRKHLDCRLVAVRLSRKIAQQRLRELKKNMKKKGRTPSDRQRVLCQWLVLITDLAVNRFSLEEIFSLCRIRRHIESRHRPRTESHLGVIAISNCSSARPKQPYSVRTEQSRHSSGPLTYRPVTANT